MKLARAALPQQAQTVESISGLTYIRKRISLTFFVKKLILWSKRLSQHLLSDATYFIYRVVTFFNEIVKAIYIRSRAIYRLKIIARTSSIIDRLLGLTYTPVATSIAIPVATSVATSVRCLNLYRDIYN